MGRFSNADVITNLHKPSNSHDLYTICIATLLPSLGFSLNDFFKHTVIEFDEIITPCNNYDREKQLVSFAGKTFACTMFKIHAMDVQG